MTIVDWIVEEENPVVLGTLMTIFTWLMTAVGAAVVLFKDEISDRVLEAFFGFSAGVMLSASYFSLLGPAVEQSKAEYPHIFCWVPVAVGFVIGNVGIYGVKKWVDSRSIDVHDGSALVEPMMIHNYPKSPLQSEDSFEEIELQELHDSNVDVQDVDDSADSQVLLQAANTPESENVDEVYARRRARTMLLVLAITLHNFPEGLVVGVGAAASTFNSTVDLSDSLNLALGIGIQNIPEGLAVAMPLRRLGYSPTAAFLAGQFSGMVEPMGGIVGSLAVSAMEGVLPYALATAAGAMTFVVVHELIPEAQSGGKSAQGLVSFGLISGFTLMMILDVSLG